MIWRYAGLCLHSWAQLAEQVEALACREGLALATEWVPSPAVVESDCASVIKYLTWPDTQRSSSTFIILDALEEAHKLPQVNFHHVSRDQNRELAQMS